MKTLLTMLWASHFCRFLFVGGTATLLQMMLLAVLVEWANFGPVIASATAYATSAVYNYILNYYLTFASGKSHLETFPKFLMVAGFGVALNTLTFAIALEFMNHYLIAQLVAVLITLLANFLLHKFWIYRS